MTDGVIVFAYHSMGVMGLRALLDSKVNIHLVVTHRDNPKENIWFDSVARLCDEWHLRFVYSEDFSPGEVAVLIRRYEISVIFSFYYRNILPESILNQARYGAVNLHGSLLPKYRGRVPVNWQIINGETTGGITLHYMPAKPDNGDIIDQAEVPIAFSDTPLTLFARLERAGKKILARSLKGILDGTCKRVPQVDSLATYYGGRGPDDGRIAWVWSSEKIYNLIRGVTKPYPGAFSYIEKEMIIIWKSSIKTTSHFVSGIAPGTLVTDGTDVLVRTGDGHIQLEEIQFKGADYVDVSSISLFKSGKRFARD